MAKDLDSKTKSRLRSTLRRVWMWSSVHKEAKAQARIRWGVYKCNGCKKETPTNQINVDHIEPFTPYEGFKTLKDWGPGLVRLFDLDNHQILCVTCHAEKTKEENLRRKKSKATRKR